jgi:hypothetical protein
MVSYIYTIIYVYQTLMQIYSIKDNLIFQAEQALLGTTLKFVNGTTRPKRWNTKKADSKLSGFFGLLDKAN